MLLLTVAFVISTFAKNAKLGIKYDCLQIL